MTAVMDDITGAVQQSPEQEAWCWEGGQGWVAALHMQGRLGTTQADRLWRQRWHLGAQRLPQESDTGRDKMRQKIH